MFIEPRVPKESLRSSGARYALFFGELIALLQSAVNPRSGLAINIWPRCGQTGSVSEL